MGPLHPSQGPFSQKASTPTESRLLELLSITLCVNNVKQLTWINGQGPWLNITKMPKTEDWAYFLKTWGQNVMY